MDIIGNEVTQRIRAAITNKLKEVGVYVDDELPDYIMVMVANKKSKEQMMTDLALFLGTSTESFTFWLHELLDNLQATTSVEPPKQATPSKEIQEPSPSPPPPPPPPPEPEVKEPKEPPPPLPPLPPFEEDNDEVLTFQTELETDDILMQELQNQENAILEVQQAVESKKISLRSSLFSSRSPEKVLLPVRTSAKVRPIFHRKSVPQSAVHRPIKSYNSYLSNDEDDEGEDKYDPRNPAVNSVASIVRVTERRSSIPRALQANKLLLFKAMEDANKSVTFSHRKNEVSTMHVEPYEPTPISKLKKPTLRVVSPVISEEPEMVVEEAEEPLVNEQMAESGEDEDTLLLQEDSKEIHVPVVMCKMPVMPIKRKINREAFQPPDIVQRNPRFVVTLDGVDPKQFMGSKTLRSVVSQRDVGLEELLDEQDDEMDEKSDLEVGEMPMDEEMEEDDEVPVKKARVLVRCRKWPACHRGDACHFHHPKVHCKTFPNCSFGKKCLYIHPNCRFDTFCTKEDCPFTHAGKRNIPIPQAIPICVAPEIIPVSSSVVCKFHPECLNPNCTFYHPKNCRFGLHCKNPSCQFGHPTSPPPPPHQLKWTAPKSQMNRKFCLPTSEHMPVQIDK